MSWVADTYGTISDIEIVWTLIVAVGLVVSVYNFSDALGDWQVADSAPPLQNGRRRIALANWRVEAARLIIQSIFLLIGVAAMCLPDASAAELPWKYQAFGALFRWGLISASLLITLQSIENRRMRQFVVAVANTGGSK